MHSMLSYPLDAPQIMRKRRTIRQELLEKNTHMTDKRIAILGGSTTHDIREILELFLLDQNIRPLFYESEYGQYWQDAMFGADTLKAFKPDIIFIHTSNRNITGYPDAASTAEDVEELLQAQFQHFVTMWDRLQQEYHCLIIQNNFEYPYYRLRGNRDAVDVQGRVCFITRLNMLFAEYARDHENFFINDINYQSADYGLERWSDPIAWYMYKYALSLNAIPTLAFNIANIIKSIYGKNKKALALDLDNTLWGGIVGDDGVENLVLGQETSMGQAYTEFQEYLKCLRQQGVVLCVISKNEHENAIAGLNHPQMVLKPEDFVDIEANWDPKSRNLTRAAQKLSLLPESFVFVDDNPAEQEQIRQGLPETAVIAARKVEEFAHHIDKGGYFETTYVSGDDLRRSEMYRENLKRVQLQESYADYGDYLRSLNMRAEIRPFADIYMARIAQLTNKTNQFNLTTKRFSQEEIEKMAGGDHYITLYGKLEDCYGDNGVVSVVIGRINGEEIDIILWLMSCRVLKRDMEYAMMDELVSRCKKTGLKKINGYYYPTLKNSMVKDFYGTMGFTKISEDETGNTKWFLNVENEYEKKNRNILVIG